NERVCRRFGRAALSGIFQPRCAGGHRCGHPWHPGSSAALYGTHAEVGPADICMSNCGSLGWFSDEAGYRYQNVHPQTGSPWPAIPDVLLQLWADVGQYPYAPEACLINYYGPQARMGLHQDRDEADFAAPVVSVSLGDACLFRIGGDKR